MTWAANLHQGLLSLIAPARQSVGMQKIFAFAIALAGALLAGAAWAVVSSYGSISGTATVNNAITLDILESYSDVNGTATNDSYYAVETTYQGETKWVKLKILNSADVSIPINMSVSGGGPDVTIGVFDENKSAALSNPISVPASQLYVWIKHAFSSAANPGSYSFGITVAPA